jgi:hypothetical protein
MRQRYSSVVGRAGGRQLPLGRSSRAAHLRRHEHGQEVGGIDSEARSLTVPRTAGMAGTFLPFLPPHARMA